MNIGGSVARVWLLILIRVSTGEPYSTNDCVSMGLALLTSSVRFLWACGVYSDIVCTYLANALILVLTLDVHKSAYVLRTVMVWHLYRVGSLLCICGLVLGAVTISRGVNLTLDMMFSGRSGADSITGMLWNSSVSLTVALVVLISIMCTCLPRYAGYDYRMAVVLY